MQTNLMMLKVAVFNHELSLAAISLMQGSLDVLHPHGHVGNLVVDHLSVLLHVGLFSLILLKEGLVLIQLLRNGVPLLLTP